MSPTSSLVSALGLILATKFLCVVAQDVDPCENFYCENGGYCVHNGDAPRCICGQGIFGEFCEIDLCNGWICQNGGSCSISPYYYPICECQYGFTGERCESQLCPPANSCGGCPDGEACLPTGINCVTAPCPETFTCVAVPTPEPPVVCDLHCLEGYECQLQVPTCRSRKRQPCNTRPVPKCVPKCPTIKRAERKCPKWWKPGNTCKDDNDCRKKKNERCCPSQCEWNVCTFV